MIFNQAYVRNFGNTAISKYTKHSHEIFSVSAILTATLPGNGYACSVASSHSKLCADQHNGNANMTPMTRSAILERNARVIDIISTIF